MEEKIKTLYTIFNRNDPTPTANALRTIDFENAVVLILGLEDFNPTHLENLARFKTWLTGSPRYHVEEEEEEYGWPDMFWKQNWEWDGIDSEKVSFLTAEGITSDLANSIASEDTVDVTSGTKIQVATLIQELHNNHRNPNIVLQIQNNQTLNISTGNLTPQMTPLNLRERVWLSSGYIIDYEVKGDPKIGEIWIGTRKKVSNRGVFPKVGEISKKLRKNINLVQGYWLEEAVTHMMSTWSTVSETYLGPRLITPSFSRAAGAAFFTITARLAQDKHGRGPLTEYKESILNIDELEDYEEKRHQAFEFLLKTEFNRKQIRSIHQCLHSVEFDSVAFDASSGKVYVVECKAMTEASQYFTAGVPGRVFAITKLVFPTTGVPMLAYCGTTSKISSGVYQIAWPELATEEILSQLPKTYIVDEVKKLHANFENLRPLLNIIRADPRAWELFVDIVRENGINTKGLWKKMHGLGKSYKLFELDHKKRHSVDWISFRDEKQG
ncbi:MAG: hypothetical protein VW230_07860 [Candidatus Poseidoniales archaeon]